MAIYDTFGTVRGHLSIGKVDLVELAKKYGTPLIVESERRIVDNSKRIKSAFGRYYDNVSINFAVKANPNPAIVRILNRQGIGADAASPAEIDFAFMAGVKKQNILFSPNYVSVDELRYALSKGVTINFDDTGQFEALSKYGVPKRVAFRLNPGFGKGSFPGIVTAGPEAKFGIPLDQIEKAYRLAKENGVERFGIHMMAGSNVLESGYFSEITSRIMDIAGRLSNKLGITFEFIDLGGGFGVPYKFNEKPLDIERTAELVTRIFKQKCDEYSLDRPQLMMEPGRYLVADSAVLLGSVHHVKRYSKIFVGTDVGMNTIIRPALYGAYHEVIVANKMNAKATIKASVTGQICENTDIIAKDRMLADPQIGDTIAVFTAGAYVYTMSSQYGSRPRPAEVLISESGAAKLIRRRENLNDLKATLV